MAESNSCSRDQMTHKPKTFTTWLFTEKVCQSGECPARELCLMREEIFFIPQRYILTTVKLIGLLIF